MPIVLTVTAETPHEYAALMDALLRRFEPAPTVFHTMREATPAERAELEDAFPDHMAKVEPEPSAAEDVTAEVNAALDKAELAEVKADAKRKRRTKAEMEAERAAEAKAREAIDVLEPTDHWQGRTSALTDEPGGELLSDQIAEASLNAEVGGAPATNPAEDDGTDPFSMPDPAPAAPTGDTSKADHAEALTMLRGLYGQGPDMAKKVGELLASYGVSKFTQIPEDQGTALLAQARALAT